MTGCSERGELLGGYVLGALEPAEMEAMRRHLESCPRCAREERELSGLPSLLDEIDPADVPPPVLAAEVEERVLDRFVRERAEPRVARLRRPRVRAALAAGALVAALLVAVILLLPGEEESAVYATAELRGTAGSADAELTTVPAGTQVSLEASGLRGGAYELWCVRSDGRWVSGGTFRASAGGEAAAELTAAVSPGDYHRIVITRRPAATERGMRGKPLLRGPLRY